MDRITEEEKDAIFFEQIEPYVLEKMIPSRQPKAMILGGQPGAGKSGFIQHIKENSENNENYTVINSDDLRGFHPFYFDLLKKNEENASDLVQDCCNFWTKKIIDLAINNKSNVIIEGTMRNPQIPIETARNFRNNNYHVGAYVIIASSQLSLASIFYRFEMQKYLTGYGRFSNPNFHRDVIKILSKNVSEISKSGYFYQFKIYERLKDQYEKIYDSDSPEHLEKNIESVCEDVIKKKLMQEEINYIINLWKNINKLAKERGANTEYLKTLAEYYREFKNETLQGENTEARKFEGSYH